MISVDEGKLLLKLARESIISYFSNSDIDYNSNKDYSHFSEKLGAFVTLHKDGDLRGCIGFPEPTYPLNRAIYEGARSAAFGDPRFPPLRESELDEIDIEISVLTKPELLDCDPSEYEKRIKIGRDGLIIRSPMGSGLLLPQVPVEWNWDSAEFLSHICQKARLSHGAYRNPDTKLYTFQAQIFSEENK